MKKLIKYNISDSGCWLCYSHGCDSNGYPMVTIKGKCDRIYRHVFNLFNGLSKGDVVRHICDNRLCINPQHLKKGTHQLNVQDRVTRNRSAKGINHGRTKLTEEQVISIKADNKTPKMHLAKKYGVDPKVIRDIKNGVTWKHIQNPVIT